ncbi:MAG: response regulator transcription factor [Verrucomicrobiota bacterium]
MKPTPLSLLIVDDHPIFRQGLRQIIEAQPGFCVVQEAGDGAAAVKLAATLKPDIILLDIDMPGMNGLDAMRAMRQQRVTAGIICLTMYKEADMFNEAMNLGATGYVLKDSAAQDILAGIKSVAAGRRYISPTLADCLFARSVGARALHTEKPGLDQLTPAERRILQRIADDKTSKEIAEELGLSPRTIENHRANISQKLDLHGSHSLLKFAYENKARL